MIKKGYTFSPLITRFEDKVFYSPDGCWYWTGALNSMRYGIIRVSGKTELAHRIGYKIFIGDTKGLCVLHQCDNTMCVNPYHMFLGTMLDNSRDMVRKGRSYNRFGANNPRAILDHSQVLVIREAKKIGFKRNDIANYFKVKVCTIDDITYGRSWVSI